MQRQQAPSGLKLGSSQYERGRKARLRASNYPPLERDCHTLKLLKQIITAFKSMKLPIIVHTKIIKAIDNSIQINDTTNNCHTLRLLKQMTTSFNKSMTPPIIVTH